VEVFTLFFTDICACIAFVKRYLAMHNVKALKHQPYSPNLSPPDVFLVSRLNNFLKGRHFASVKEFTLTEVLKNGFHDSFQKLYESWQNCITVQRNYLKENVV
jgi:hypothetical protein